jgi:hypothetical protein
MTLPAGTTVTLYVTADVSLTSAPHGTRLGVQVPSAADLTWGTPAAVVTRQGFPLASAGTITVADVVQAQIAFTPQPGDTTLPGSRGVPILQLRVPDDGGVADRLMQFDVQQSGTGAPLVEVEQLWLQETGGLVAEDAAPHGERGQHTQGVPTWRTIESAQFFHTGAGRWSASGLDLVVPPGGLELRVLADVGSAARAGRTVQGALPTSGLVFASGRRGPEDSGWTNPGVLVIGAQRRLAVVQTTLAPIPNPVRRDASRLPVLGLGLTVQSAADDTLRSLRLRHTSTGPTGPAAHSSAEIAQAELWLDTDRDGAVGSGDTRLAGAVPDSTGAIDFGTPGLHVPLPVDQQVDFVVTLTPDSIRVRDAEQLRVRLEQPGDVATAGGLLVDLPGPLETTNPPRIDGQDAAGYAVVPVAGGALFGNNRAEVLDIRIPANGVDDDVLEGLRLENSGTAVAADIGTLELLLDDGDGVPGANDVLLGRLDPVGLRIWETSGLSGPLPAAGSGRRFLVTVSAGTSPQAGATFLARVPALGITVTSGNDGPIDRPLSGGNPLVLSAPDRVTWLAGISGSHAVRPDESRRPVMVLEVFNGYTTPQSLRELEVRSAGTAREAEYGLWGLYPDDNANGILDPGEAALAAVSPQNGRIQFSGFDWVIAPQAQQRLLVTYSLVLGNARDGSVIDAFVPDAQSFRYADDRTATAAAFPLDSPGVCTVDGFLRAQVGDRQVASRTLGGSETNVLALDLLLPANGLDADTLTALGLELADPATAGVLGVDFTGLRLWRDSDADTANGRFDPATDVFLQSAAPQGQRLQFANLSAPVAPGGQRFYVTLDTSADPTDGRRMQLVVPVNGVEMASGDDGPIDASLVGGTHVFSSSALLAGIAAAADIASRGQTIDVAIQVRNQGSVNLQGILPIRLEVDPPGAATLVSGPVPATLALAAGATGSFACRFRLDQTGLVRFTSQAALADSSVQSEPTTSLPVRVVDPPTRLKLALLSTLPPAVNRGQRVTPLVWQLGHPDPDSTSAAIRIDSLSVVVQDAAGTPQPASTVLSALEIGSGGSTYARWTSIPALSALHAQLDPPLVLRGGQTAELALAVTIAPQATARDLSFRLTGAAAVRAVDGNTGAPVTLNATLPWSSAAAVIHTQATQIAVTAVRTLPAAVNRGQMGVPAGRLVLSLPGAPDESEARVIRLAMTLRDSAGSALPPADLLSAFRVTNGATVLYETHAFDAAPGPLDLTLDIPVLIASGAAQAIDIGLDLRADTALHQFAVALVDSAALDVRDAPSGAAISVRLQSPETFPWIQGPARVEAPAGNLAVRAVSRLPASTFAGQRRMPVADVWLSRAAELPGTAGVEIRSLTFRLLDDAGRTLVPADVVSAVRLLANGVPADATGAPPDAAASMTLALVSPLHLAPGDSLDLGLEADLSTAVATPWLRFALEPNALAAVDANDPARSIFATGGLPFATGLTRIVAQPNRVAFGPTGAPPVNVGRGTQAEVLALRILHPGAANQAELQPESLYVLVRDARGVGLAASTVVSAASLRLGGTNVDARLVGDRLVFDLDTLPPLAAGAAHDLALWLDLRATPAAADFRLRLDAGALSAASGGIALLDTPLDGISFPWLSASIHLAATNLAESVGIYPNPFTPGRHPGCNLTFFLPADAHVTAELYTLAGERVRSLLRSAPLGAGLHDEIAWDGRNGAGEMVRSGTYLLRLDVAGPGGGEFLRKLAVMR